ncbi:hypothetical protein [Nocardioides panzhihuensis]|uniref:Uncharacterized protein n=1 Tax=Nocardioides panzhihuensis TaxID=860243 RepID=A0A7Z0DJA6_9ACTN|nr:hypothetical protein [Nocardioides panzhihuensis]NYI76634.1 hypothetical protein [Nocardioides panzhihuensis]
MKVAIFAVDARGPHFYVNATVERVQVRFRSSRDEARTGWQCEMHGDVDSCAHVEALLPVLAGSVRQKLRRVARTGIR